MTASLICSIFFLAVIASRLRFSDIADKVRTALNLAKAYNAKEEVLHDELEISGKTTKRLDALTIKVNEQLYQATLVLEEINPVMQYMQYFRNAGILVFLIILISSSLFITSVLGWTFLLLAVATYFYFNRTQIATRLKSFALNFRIEFVKRGYWLLAIAFSPQVVGFILRVFFQVRNVDWSFALSYFLLGVYLFAWLVLAAHVDEQFGEIETNNDDRARLSRWKFVKNALAVWILILALGLTFKQVYFAGANEMLTLSLFSISILMFFVGYYLTKVKWLGIICGWIMAIASIGSLFKILHLEGADEMRLISISCSIALIPIVIWKRKMFHFLMIRFCIATVIIGLYFSPFFQNALIVVKHIYEHGSLRVQKVLGIVEANQAKLFLTEGSKAVDLGIEESDAYIKQYGTDFGFTLVYREMIVEYEKFVLTALGRNESDPKKDSTLLPLVLKIARQQHKMARLFHFNEMPDNGLEAEVLLALGKREEAIHSLEEIVPFIESEEEKEEMKAKLVSLKKEGQ